MANVFIQDSTMTAIGDAIRAKTGSTDKLFPADMATAISGITTGGGGSGVSSAGLAIGDRQEVDTASSTGKWVVSITIPKDATNVYAYHGNINLTALNSSYTVLKENYASLESRVIAPSEIIESDLGDGFKTVTLFNYTLPSYSGAKYYTIKQKTEGVAYGLQYTYTMPNVTIENNVLYAGKNCEGLWNKFPSSGRNIPYYLEGVDLRGSKVQKLHWGDFSKVVELKKFWMSETMNTLEGYCLSDCINLEEIHFTSENPPTISHSAAFANLPTTCKLYVPAGKLSAYTSAQYYPDPTTYTYIEE